MAANEVYASGGPIELSIYRDIIVHTASIIETCLHYCLVKLGKVGKLDLAKLDTEWKVSDHKVIHTISETELIIGARKTKTAKAFASNPSSETICRAAFNASVLDETLFQKAEAIREARNKIHLVGKEEVTLYPTKEELDDIFTDTRDILERAASSLG